jgi:hypothetical protein
LQPIKYSSQQTHIYRNDLFYGCNRHLEVSQRRLSSAQRYSIVATYMVSRNQLTIRGNKHASIATLNQYYRNGELVVAIGTHKRNHLFHRGINNNLLQLLFQTTQPTFLVAIISRYRNPKNPSLPSNELLQPIVWCCKKIWCSKPHFLVM